MIKGVYSINIAVKDLAANKKYEAIFGVTSEALGEKNFAFPGLIGSKLNVNGFYINLIAICVKINDCEFRRAQGWKVFFWLPWRPTISRLTQSICEIRASSLF